jgi:hypothetical protein
MHELFVPGISDIPIPDTPIVDFLSGLSPMALDCCHASSRVDGLDLCRGFQGGLTQPPVHGNVDIPIPDASISGLPSGPFSPCSRGLNSLATLCRSDGGQGSTQDLTAQIIFSCALLL